MSLAQQYYKIWKRQRTVDLRVYTDEQMFEIGFEAGRLFELDKMIEEEKQVKRATTKLSKNKKA